MMAFAVFHVKVYVLEILQLSQYLLTIWSCTCIVSSVGLRLQLSDHKMSRKFYRNSWSLFEKNFFNETHFWMCLVHSEQSHMSYYKWVCILVQLLRVFFSFSILSFFIRFVVFHKVHYTCGQCTRSVGITLLSSILMSLVKECPKFALLIFTEVQGYAESTSGGWRKPIQLLR